MKPIPVPTFKPTAKQQEALDLMKHHPMVMLFGGGGSGKTFVIMTAIIARAIQIPGSRHGVFRQTAKACRQTLFQQTFREAFKALAPDLYKVAIAETGFPKINIQDMTVEFENGSVIMFGGLDDDNRLETVLGQNLLSAYFNEVSQIANYKPVSTVITRLRQIIPMP